MLIIGLTGSIGMGKSTVASHLRARGVPVCDADVIVHALYTGPAIAPVEAAFPGTTSLAGVNRAKLSAALLAGPEAFRRLEAIVHPMVQDAERACLRDALASGATIACLEVPLLFETGGDARVDFTIVVDATPEIQRARVLARPDMTPDKLAAILARQVPREEKRRRADFVVDTGIALAETFSAVDRILAGLAERKGTAYARFWSVPATRPPE